MHDITHSVELFLWEDSFTNVSNLPEFSRQERILKVLKVPLSGIQSSFFVKSSFQSSVSQLEWQKQSPEY